LTIYSDFIWFLLFNFGILENNRKKKMRKRSKTREINYFHKYCKKEWIGIYPYEKCSCGLKLYAYKSEVKDE